MKNNLAQFLRAKRVAVGLSQKEVAFDLGYSTPQFVSNWERGVSRPPINALKRIGEMYKCSAEDLFEIVLTAEVHELTNELRRKFASSKAR